MVTQRRLPAEVYWRRRLLLLALVIALAWGVVRLWPGGAETPASVAAPGPTPSSTPEPSASAPSTEAEPDPEPASQTATVTLAAPSADCDPEQVRITPSVAEGQEAGDDVAIDLVVSTTSSTPCTLKPADAALVAVISAGDTAIWDSDVCSGALLTAPVALSPRWSTVAPTTWNGRRSGPACSDGEDRAPAGTYTMRVGTLGGEPGTAGFRLEPRSEEPESDEK